MGQQAINNIMEGLKLHQQRVLEQKRLQIEQDYRTAQVDLEKKKFDEEIKQHDLVNKASKAFLDMQLESHKAGLAKTGQEIGAEYGKTGVLPLGASIQPTASSLPSGEANYSPINPAAATGQALNIPGIGSTQLSTQAQDIQRAQNAAQVAEISAKPARETERLKQEEETQRQIKVTTAAQQEETKRFLSQIDKTQTAETVRAAEANKSRERIAAADNTTRMNIAKLPYQMFGASNDQQKMAVVNPYLDALNSGTISAAQIKKDFSEKGMVGGDTAILSTFMSSGRIPPNDKQVSFIQNIKPVIDIIPTIKDYIKMLPVTTSGIEAKINGIKNIDILNQELAAKMAQIKFNIATVAKNLSGDQGQRLQKALLEPAEGGFFPDKSKSTTYNISNFNRFLGVVNSALDAELGSLTPDQRVHIKDTLGLSKMTSMGLETLQPTQQQQTPLSPAALELMKKHGIQ